MKINISREMEDIVIQFLKNRSTDLLVLDKSLKKNNFSEIENIGHQIAGNSGSYGFSDLGEMGENLEKYAIQQDKEKIKRQILEIASYLENLKINFS